MAKEISPDITEYVDLKNSLEGYRDDQSLDEYFQKLDSLKNKLFENGTIFEKPELLIGFNVVIRQGEDGAESTSYRQGKVLGIEKDREGTLKAILIEGYPKLIPYHPLITFISPLT